jgi:hypothetical protein
LNSPKTKQKVNLLNLKINTNKKRTIPTTQKKIERTQKKLIRAHIESLTNTKKYENFKSKKLNLIYLVVVGKRGEANETRTSFLK